MQMVAASKMRKAQQAPPLPACSGNFCTGCNARATTHVEDFVHPLMKPREVRKRAVILPVRIRLCGSLNTNLFRVASQFDPETTVYIAVGKRPAQFVACSRRKLIAEFTVTDSPRFAEARPIAAFARDLFSQG